MIQLFTHLPSAERHDSTQYSGGHSGNDKHELTYFLAYLLSPWSRVTLDKLTGFPLVKKFPVFYGTRRFVTAFTNASHLSLS